MKERIAEKIRLLRLSRNLSQQNIADELNITVAAYSNIERGVSDINLTRLEAIARILGTTPTELISDSSGDGEQTFMNTVNQQLLLMMKQLELFRHQLEALQQEVRSLKH